MIIYQFEITIINGSKINLETIVGLMYLGLFLLACSTEEPPSDNIRDGDDGGEMEDARPKGSGSEPNTNIDSCQGAPSELGGLCEKGSCLEELACMPEQMVRMPVHLFPSNTESTLDFSMFSNGMCSKECEVDNDDCAPCGKCINMSFMGRYLVPASPDPTKGICALSCSPSLFSNGGCPQGTTCAPGGVCLNACTDDRQCRFYAEDGNGDGIVELILDSESRSRCNLETGLCEHPEGSVGHVCRNSSDCSTHSECLLSPITSEGVCVRGYCEKAEDIPCESGEVCDIRLADRDADHQGSMCLPGCKVGAEPQTDRLGLNSHGKECPIGFACLWDGTSDAEADINGGCFPTPSHNTISEPNLGILCTDHNQCYSPWGLGHCEFLDLNEELPGICAVGECSNYPKGTTFDGILPAVASDLPICPKEQGVCVNQSPAGHAPMTFCYKACKSPNDCPGRFACAQPYPDAVHLCWPECQNSSECKDSESCLRNADKMPCTGTSGESCRCFSEGELVTDSSDLTRIGHQNTRRSGRDSTFYGSLDKELNCSFFVTETKDVSC